MLHYSEQLTHSDRADIIQTMKAPKSFNSATTLYLA